jgi:hypothetical protein
VPQPSVEAPAYPEPDLAIDTGAANVQGNGYGGDYQDDNYDDDDDVDFNLGNGSTGAAPPPAAPVKEESSTPTYTTRGPSAKEDG